MHPHATLCALFFLLLSVSSAVVVDPLGGQWASMTVLSEGVPAVAYTRGGDLWYSRSLDDLGASWSAPLKVLTGAGVTSRRLLQALPICWLTRLQGFDCGRRQRVPVTVRGAVGGFLCTACVCGRQGRAGNVLEGGQSGRVPEHGEHRHVLQPRAEQSGHAVDLRVAPDIQRVGAVPEERRQQQLVALPRAAQRRAASGASGVGCWVRCSLPPLPLQAGMYGQAALVQDLPALVSCSSSYNNGTVQFERPFDLLPTSTNWIEVWQIRGLAPFPYPSIAAVSGSTAMAFASTSGPGAGFIYAHETNYQFFTSGWTSSGFSTPNQNIGPGTSASHLELAVISGTPAVVRALLHVCGADFLRRHSTPAPDRRRACCSRAHPRQTAQTPATRGTSPQWTPTAPLWASIHRWPSWRATPSWCTLPTRRALGSWRFGWECCVAPH